ncbi:Gfo/Idh/MocA family oxidoreductase [Methanoculleus sp. FWC-SCC1]|uniref:Gfo/Idh/MocA family oxidoreductase n=1 Tax=Methanoculleus frigidifontis TaxID=2584085 RepID=A0ABT8MC10_9EURY|nr:Gfo/Idh/MocA family oxidoreductase [Methanoculleus sp. FWC-SCC1]MDN7025426.1 Gfo/Idh/MocA family oxidoreductase [Methanoculleus sp. FWC-SCC1]
MDVGVIGVGVMGRNHVRVYSELKRVGSLYLYDLNQKAADDLARKHDATACADLDEMLRRVDAVSVCVPTRYHYATAQQVIAREVPLLLEKPICSTAAQSRALLAEIPEDLTVGVGHIERFNPIVGEIRRIVTRPLYVEFKRHNPASGRITDSSVVEDLMIHDIDIMRNVLFDGAYGLSSVGTTDVCSALFTFDGTPVYLSASRKSSKKIRSVYIEQEDMTIEGDFMTQEVYVHRKPGQYASENERYVQENIIEKVLVNKVEPLKVELATFLDCAKQNKPFPITPDQAATNLAICEEIARSF